MEHKAYFAASMFLAFVAALSLLVYAFGLFHVSSASTIMGNEYYSTTTSSAVASSTKLWTLKSSSGSLGSIIVTMQSNATGYPSMKVYDATSTMATATARVLASMSTSTQTQGTYQFDTQFNYGLSIEMPASYTGSYTVTYR